ncbi:MAG: hypothetical protein PVG60_03725 [Desulfarculaceae bacterium]|jgi:hypothetical protein
MNKRYYRLVLVGMLLICLGLAPAEARAQESTLPHWNLAVVVEGSDAMHRPWRGSTRALEVQKALPLELRTLPFRVTAAVWQASGQRAVKLVPPRSGAHLKALVLDIPPARQKADLAAGIESALAWLRRVGGGSLLLLTSGQGLSRKQVEGLPLGKGSVFSHVLALAPGSGTGPLEHLALRGCGGYFEASGPQRLGPMLHQAVRTALSPARLLILAHNAQNQPLNIIYGLQRNRQMVKRRLARSGRPAQVLAGGYELDWPAHTGLGPAPIPKRAQVGRRGVTRLWAGGKGKLEIQAQDKDGAPLTWTVKVVSRREGEVVVPPAKLPLKRELPAGLYLIRFFQPPQSWIVELGAGANLKLVTGPPASLRFNITGPGGDVRLPYSVSALGGIKRRATGYTNSWLKLLPGRYQIQVQTVPPLAREVALKPGQKVSVDLPPLGEVLVMPAKVGEPLRFEVLDLKGRILASGISGQALPLFPGSYRLRLQVSGSRLHHEVEVRAGQTSIIPTPDRPR